MKVVVLDADMFCPWRELWRLVYLYADLVILKNFAFDLGKGEVNVENDSRLLQLKKTRSCRAIPVKERNIPPQCLKVQFKFVA